MSSPRGSKDLRGTWPRALASLAGSLLFILAIRWALIEPYVIPSESMLPTLLVHDHIMVNKFAYGVRLPFTEHYFFRFSFPKRGDVLVFRSVEDDHVFLVKRVVGLPGDEIQIKDDGLYVNGKAVEQRQIVDQEKVDVFRDWSKDAATAGSDQYDVYRENLDSHFHFVFRDKFERLQESAVTKVPDDQLFMSGDNRDHSADSRAWGPLPFDRVLGRASVIWLSCEEALAQSGQLCNPQTVRWQRLFSGVQ